MTKQGVCVVTGGAGFIGCALAPGLAARFDRVVALDSLHPQVHAERRRPTSLAAEVELFVGDVADPGTWKALLADVRPDAVVHLAAETGTGQSLTEAARHAHANVTGTAAMLETLARVGHIPGQIVLASSRAVYGEGPWCADADGALIHPAQRTREQLARGEWDVPGATALPADAATAMTLPVSIYGATKLAQEHMLRAWAGAFGAAAKVLRLQNVYGPGQALANSYTGIVALFCRLARAGRSIPLYEDGRMLRDFVLIDDVADALLGALDRPAAAGRTLDIGSGRRITVADAADTIARLYDAPPPHLCGQYRYGDVRHASCETGPARDLLGWEARIDFETGVARLADWIEHQPDLAAGVSP